jgi:hypothetical protein
LAGTNKSESSSQERRPCTDGDRQYLLQVRHDLLKWRREIFTIELRPPLNFAVATSPVQQLVELRKVLLQSRECLRETLVSPEAREKVDNIRSMHDVLVNEIDLVALKLAPDMVLAQDGG